MPVDSFNLDPPPGFRGFDPNRPLHTYGHNLLRWRQEGATYFVTFHLDDALSACKYRVLAIRLREWLRNNPAPRSNVQLFEFLKEQFRRVEQFIDAGHGVCWLREPPCVEELRRSIFHFHLQRYEVGAFVIMENHCHMIIRPFDSVELEDEIGAIKSVISHFVNRYEAMSGSLFVNRYETMSGSLWYPESYDFIITDAENLYQVVQYIGSNPWRAGLAIQENQRWINPAWQACGWDFLDL